MNLLDYNERRLLYKFVELYLKLIYDFDIDTLDCELIYILEEYSYKVDYFD